MYTYTDKKLPFTKRIASVESQVRGRLRPWICREETFLASQVSTEGKNPFADVFEEMPDAPYVIALAHAIVRSWVDAPCVIYPNEAIAGVFRPMYPIAEHFSWGIQFYEWTMGKEEKFFPPAKNKTKKQKNRVNIQHGFLCYASSLPAITSLPS